MAMTPRERWVALFNRQQPDRLVCDYWGTDEITRRLQADLGCKDYDALMIKLGVDRPGSAWPKPKIAHHPDDPQADMWGIRHTNINYGTGEYNEASHGPLTDMTTVEEIDAYHWPSVDNLDFSHIREQAASQPDRFVQGGGYEPFLLYCSMRGMEQAYEDMLVNPEICESILSHIFDFHYEMNRRIFEAGHGKIDMMYMAEDLGGQTGPLFSLEVYRKFLRPKQKKMADLAKSYGIKIFYHTDGAARTFLLDLIDVVGIDLLNPIQWRCPGMEIEGLVRDFGKKVIFHSAIDNQQTLPFGTVDDVKTQVRECAELFKGHRWICGPCHNLQPVTPTANVVAMYEAAHAIKL